VKIYSAPTAFPGAIVLAVNQVHAEFGVHLAVAPEGIAALIKRGW
jgi:hypothetical protein